jgi:hypothetical protein
VGVIEQSGFYDGELGAFFLLMAWALVARDAPQAGPLMQKRYRNSKGALVVSSRLKVAGRKVQAPD